MIYVKEALKNQKLGKEIKAVRNTKSVVIPEKLNQVLKTQPDANDSFNALTPGKQREYCNYIADAKPEATKQTRIEKITPMILRMVLDYILEIIPKNDATF